MEAREVATGPVPVGHTTRQMAGRYAEMVSSEEVARWAEIFNAFDCDGDGDVDERELGLMFRRLGHAPSQEETMFLVETVDIDKNGRIDFEEFCLLMLRQQRLATGPEWMRSMFQQPFTELQQNDAATLPVTVNINSAKYEAVRRIRRQVQRWNRTFPVQKPAETVHAAPASGCNIHTGPTAQPPQLTTFSRTLLLTVVDLLPYAKHVKTVHLSGHGDVFGPFVMGELLWRLRNTRWTTIENLNIRENCIRDDGTILVAQSLPDLPTLVSLDLSSNQIRQRGAEALRRSLQKVSARSKLQVLTIDDNPISEEVLTAVEEQMLSNRIPHLIAACQKAECCNSNPLDHEQDILDCAGGMEPKAGPFVCLNEPAMSAGHMLLLKAELEMFTRQQRSVQDSPSRPKRRAPKAKSCAALSLLACPKVTDSDCAVLLDVSPQAPESSSATTSAVNCTPDVWSTLQWLRISGSGLGDKAAEALCTAMETGRLHHLVGLALDSNQLTLHRMIDADNRVLAKRMGDALRRLPALEELDLCNNVNLGDEQAAALCNALLASTQRTQKAHEESPTRLRAKRSARITVPSLSAASSEVTTLSSLRTLHLGGTKCGDLTAGACAGQLSACQLVSLCLAGHVGDVGACAIASALPSSESLHYLRIGCKIGDKGAEQLAAAISTGNGCGLQTLVLGGEVRGGIVLSNHIGPRGVAAIGDSLRSESNRLAELRLSNNPLGAHACLLLLGTLSSCISLRRLHIDRCGLQRDHSNALIETMEAVWCLHTLVVDSKTYDETRPSKRMLTQKQRMQLGVVLEKNKEMGRQRVHAFRIIRSLDAVAWVFSSLCAGIPKHLVEGRLTEWDGSACAQLAINMHLPQYASSFEFNLNGELLTILTINMLVELGVVCHEDQRRIMRSIRDLCEAYRCREAAAVAQARWSLAMNNAGEVSCPREVDMTSEYEVVDLKSSRPKPSFDVSDAGKCVPIDGLNSSGFLLAGTREPSQRPDPADLIRLAKDLAPHGTGRRTKVDCTPLSESASIPSRRTRITVRKQKIGTGNAQRGMARSVAQEHEDHDLTRRAFQRSSSRKLPVLTPRSAAAAHQNTVSNEVEVQVSKRINHGALPVAPWLQGPYSARGVVVHPGNSPMLHGAGGSSSARPSEGARIRHNMKREEHSSRRIMASLRMGGQMQLNTPPTIEMPRKNQYLLACMPSLGRTTVSVLQGNRERTRAQSQTSRQPDNKEVIRLQLGLSPA